MKVSRQKRVIMRTYCKNKVEKIIKIFVFLDNVRGFDFWIWILVLVIFPPKTTSPSCIAVVVKISSSNFNMHMKN